jgi:hypothetical protein
MSNNLPLQPTYATAKTKETNYSAAAAAATRAINKSQPEPQTDKCMTPTSLKVKTKRQQPTTMRSKATKYFFNIYILILIYAFICFMY